METTSKPGSRRESNSPGEMSPAPVPETGEDNWTSNAGNVHPIDLTSRFLDVTRSRVIDRLASIAMRLIQDDGLVNFTCLAFNSRISRKVENLLGSLLARQERKVGLSEQALKCMFGKKGFRHHRSFVLSFLAPVIKGYLDGWATIPGGRRHFRRPPCRIADIPPIWKGWKKLSDKLSPGFSMMKHWREHGEVKVFPNDMMDPIERINRLVEFKDVDRVGIGFSLSHAISYLGAQPHHGIGGLWQYAMGPGNKMAKAALNAWIRLGGQDYLPAPMIPLANPIPEAHSPFYYEWLPPGDTLYEQFIEKELFTRYEQVEDWGLSSLARKVTKAIMERAILGAIETLKANIIFNRHLGKDFTSRFESYAGSICALWDVIPMARGMVPFMKDLRKRPEEIIQVFEFLEPGLTEIGIAIARITGARYVLMGNSRGSSSWISPRMFEEVFWPSMKKTWLSLVKAGLKVCAHLDNDWTENMTFMLELPKHSGFFHLDQANLPMVREIIGDHFCLMGNLQPAVMAGSGPDVVYKETVKLIKTCGKDGGYIVATGCEAPAPVPIENYYAVKRAVLEHGFFKK